MTSLITKEEFRAKLLEFISISNVNELSYLRNILEDEENVLGDHPSKPSMPNFDSIKSTGEKAFQRAIFNSKKSILDYQRSAGLETVTWLDIELPVALNRNPRRKCIDIIGSLDGIPVICELKYHERSPSNHPIYGVVELLIYYYFIHCNYQKLDKYDVHHHLVLKDFKWEVIVKNGFPQLLLVANKKYWDYWFNRLNKNELAKQVFDLGVLLDANIHLFEAPNEDFIMQKGNKPSYKPELQSNVWTKIKQEFN